jgi:hypothetical protein
MIPRPKSKPIPSFLELNSDSFKLQKLASDIVDFKQKSQEEIDKTLEEVRALATETNKNLAEIKKFSDKIESNFENVTNELVGILRDIKTQGLKGDSGKDGVDADEEKVIAEVSKIVPTSDEIVKDVLKLIPENKPSLKVITESIDINAVADKVKQELDLEGDWKKKWNDIKAEISRGKGGYHGGGFNNISSSGAMVSTGLDTLNFTGATVTQSGRTVTVAVTGGGGFTILPATGAIDDSNVTFTFTSVPTLININGSFYSSTSTVGGTLVWTNVGTTITLAFPVGTGGSLFGI